MLDTGWFQSESSTQIACLQGEKSDGYSHTSMALSGDGMSSAPLDWSPMGCSEKCSVSYFSAIKFRLMGSPYGLKSLASWNSPNELTRDIF